MAIAMCRAAGWDADLEYTSPPRHKLDGPARVIRCKKIGVATVLLTVANEVMTEGGV